MTKTDGKDVSAKFRPVRVTLCWPDWSSILMLFV